MFSALRQSNILYILEKGEEPRLLFGNVESVSAPTPRFSTSYQTFGQDMVVDVVASICDEKREYKQLPANLSIANFGNSGVVVSDDRNAMLAEIEGMMANSKKILDSIPYHETIVKRGGEMVLQLNPQLAKEKEQEDRINTLEGKVSGMADNLDKMMGMLSDALENRKKKGE